MSLQRPLQSLTDDALLASLADLLRQSRRVEAPLVAHIAEGQERRLFARFACTSMHRYCTDILHLSDSEAYYRIAVARATLDHPVLLEMLADGRLHLTAIASLAPHLTPENRDVVLARAVHKSKKEVEELVAELAPRPDVPSVMRRLPEKAQVPILEKAVDVMLERIEARKFGRTRSPRRMSRPSDPSSRDVPAAVRRVVDKRDGSQCSFVDEEGRRCPERHRLEYHHHDPYARGGGKDPENIRLMCHAHNWHLAELEYGKEVMDRYRRRVGRQDRGTLSRESSSMTNRARSGPGVGAATPGAREAVQLDTSSG